MSKLTSFIERIQSKISWKIVAYVVIGLFLFKSCQGCTRSNKIERLEKNHIVVVDSLSKRIDSLNIANDKLSTIIEGKNEVNSVQIENGEFYQYKIETLNTKITELSETIENLKDTVAGRDNEIKRLKRVIKQKDGEISNLNIEINRLKVENAKLSGI